MSISIALLCRHGTLLVSGDGHFEIEHRPRTPSITEPPSLLHFLLYLFRTFEFPPALVLQRIADDIVRALGEPLFPDEQPVPGACDFSDPVWYNIIHQTPIPVLHRLMLPPPEVLAYLLFYMKAPDVLSRSWDQV